MFNTFYMKEALIQAELAKINDEIPVGAVIVHVSSEKIISRSFNKVEFYNNCLFHAEINVINNACNLLKSKYLPDCDIYVTLEPCAMCAAYISLVKIRKLFYAASNKKYGAIEHGAKLFTNENCYFRPEIYIGILLNEAQKLIKNFFVLKRKK